MASLFEQMAVSCRELSRTQRLYTVTIAVGNLVEPVRVWAINAPDAICQALHGRELNGNELRIVARLVG